MKTATFLVLMLFCASAAAQTPPMKKYVTGPFGLALQYPAGYHVADLPCSVATGAVSKGLQSLLYVTNGTGGGAAAIAVWLDRRKFGLATLQSEYAPTGVDSPPEEIHVGKRIFYSYGAGGGGALYPDTFFYDVGGAILVISFHGPYQDGEKTPSTATKGIERKVLETVRVRAPVSIYR